MKRIYLLALLVVVLSGCRRNPPSSAQAQRVAVAQFSPDGKRIVTTSKDGTTRIWDARTGQALSSTNGMVVWDLSKGQPVPTRYEAGTPDNMPIVGGDNFKV